MIITKLYGGLGNQMFQYAVARSLSIKKNVELKLDVSEFDSYKLRKYELDNFCVQGNFLNKEDICIDKQRFFYRLVSLFKRRNVKRRFKMVEETKLSFDKDVFSLQGNLYLNGYWQTEKYFKDIEETIRQDFLLKNALSEASLSVAEQIVRQSCSVSLHVRRGDYIADKKTNQTHGTCSLEYYRRCIKSLREKYQEISLFVFSDDMDWVRENLLVDCPMVFVSHNGADRSYEDMYLMSLCCHHIIANSSFSWWGAWLNPKENKLVFAPKDWFQDKTKDTRDLIPENWIKM